MKDERETKEKLLQSARAEFIAKGYQGASLRSICKNSGLTTGALYFFFKDKDDLFTSLVSPQLNALKAMLTAHMQQELLALEQGGDAQCDDFRDDAYAAQQVVHLLYQNYDLFLLLLTGSYGSSQEHFIDELVAIAEEHYQKLAVRQAALLGVQPRTITRSTGWPTCRSMPLCICSRMNARRSGRWPTCRAFCSIC